MIEQTPLSGPSLSGPRPPIRSALIVGGGMGGLSAAIALAMRGVRVTVVEEKRDWDGAAIAYFYRAVHALDELGVLGAIAEQSTVIPADAPSWWTRIYNPQGTQLGFAGPELPAGWTLPTGLITYRPTVAGIMADRARELGVELLTGLSYASIEPYEDRVDVELTTGERRSADLLIGADGIYSGVRERFFGEVGGPHYIGSMAFRMMFDDVPETWIGGLHVGGGTSISGQMLPGRRFYLALPKTMERREIAQPEAREIVRSVLAPFQPSEMWDAVVQRVTDDLRIIVNAYEWIFVPTPWHRGRVVLLGDAVHATAPTMGSAGGMAIEDGVVLGQEIAAASDLETALTAYGQRRGPRSQGVVDASLQLMRSHHQKRPASEEAPLRRAAVQRIIEPY